jgi:hypothetical protein
MPHAPSILTWPSKAFGRSAVLLPLSPRLMDDPFPEAGGRGHPRMSESRANERMAACASPYDSCPENVLLWPVSDRATALSFIPSGERSS